MTKGYRRILFDIIQKVCYLIQQNNESALIIRAQSTKFNLMFPIQSRVYSNSNKL